MDMNRLFRLVLLLLFALLQCVAPLAHAHVSGNDSNQNVHFDIIESQWLHEHDTEVTHFSIEEHHSPIVSMPPEYRSSHQALAQHIDTGHKLLLLQREYRTLIFTPPQQAHPAYPYQHPCSQAPPA